MAVVIYPSFRQCEGSNRAEVTSVYADTSASGVVRGRVMYDTSTYELTLVHDSLSGDDFDAWEAFWEGNFANQFDVTWAADGQVYRGVPSGPPSVVYINGGRWTVTLVFTVKKVAP